MKINKPQYLDSPGEFWFEKKGAGGRLYLRLPEDQDPNTADVEVARRIHMIESSGMSHVHIKGLTFRFPMSTNHNKVTDSLLNTCDWGGIETWQGGPSYVYDNISGNPGGYLKWGHMLSPNEPGQSYASAMPTTWTARSRTTTSTSGTASAGGCSATPTPLGTAAAGNAADAGPRRGRYDIASNAYSQNVFHEIPNGFGALEPSGRWLDNLGTFQEVLERSRALASATGILTDKAPLRDAAAHDFRPAPGCRPNHGFPVLTSRRNFYRDPGDPTILSTNTGTWPLITRREA